MHCFIRSGRFKEQIYDIYRYLPPETQVVLVSATLPHEVLEMTHKVSFSNKLAVEDAPGCWVFSAAAQELEMTHKVGRSGRQPACVGCCGIGWNLASRLARVVMGGRAVIRLDASVTGLCALRSEHGQLQLAVQLRLPQFMTDPVRFCCLSNQPCLTDACSNFFCRSS